MLEASSFDTVFSRIYAVRIRMRFSQQTLTGAYHWPGLAGFLKSHLEGELPPDIWLSAPDAGVPAFTAGDEYSFVLYSTNSGLLSVDRVLQSLARKNRSARSAQRADALVFGPRWEFLCAEDLFGDQARIVRAAKLEALERTILDTDASFYHSIGQCWIRLTSPLQLLREREGRPARGLQRFCRDANDLDGKLFLDRVRQSFDALGRRLGVSVSLPIPDARIDITASDLFWHGAQQMDAKGGEKPVYGLGGVLGLQVEGPDAALVWRWLVLGQHLGIGQRRGFGLGRYRLEGPDGERIGALPERRASLLRSSFSLGNLDSAWEAIRNNRRRTAFERELDQVTFGLPPDADQRSELVRLARQLEAGEYNFPPLEGVLIEKPKGGQRALAVPPLLDRVLQRAVAQMLVHIIEPVMYARSFGYRPGRNRMQARDLIQRLVREGYSWFFESDIDSFFDAVDPTLIYNRLMSLLPDDTAVDRIMRWITAPVRFQGRLVQRGGLPQGSPLSPLLANLVLDDFDRDLVAAGFMPVRFADDFIVPCKSREQAQRASEVVLASLGEKGLSLNDDQTRIARFADGLKFLGYRFLNDLAIETRKPRRGSKVAAEAPHPESWHARISDDHPPDCTVQQEPNDEDMQSSVEVGFGQAGRAGTLVILSEPGCVVFTREGRLWSQHEDAAARMIGPWNEIGGLLLMGYQRFTQTALHRAMEHRIPVYFTDGFGRLKGTLHGTSNPDKHLLWLKQIEACRRTDLTMQVARELVAARLHHQGQVLRRRGVDGKTLRRLKQLQKKTTSAPALEILRGIEGSATRVYFGTIGRLLPGWVGFEGRNRRPPRDPFNALLSLGYSMLYSHTDTLVQVAGLMSSHGFYHQPRGRHAALASDMMEPFRHLIEGTAVAQLNRRQLSDSDFQIDENGACRLRVSGRHLFLRGLAKRLAGSMTNSDGQSMSGHEHLYAQAGTLASSLVERDSKFKATRLK